jgi:hypothetical protein
MHGAARWAVRLAGAVVVVLVISYATLGIAYATGGSDAVEDTWVGYLAGVSLIGGLGLAFVAFILALLGRATRQRWPLLWLPLSLFPALVTIVAVAEVFWLE